MSFTKMRVIELSQLLLNARVLNELECNEGVAPPAMTRIPLSLHPPSVSSVPSNSPDPRFAPTIFVSFMLAKPLHSTISTIPLHLTGSHTLDPAHIVYHTLMTLHAFLSFFVRSNFLSASLLLEMPSLGPPHLLTDYCRRGRNRSGLLAHGPGLFFPPFD
ncbi:uncharacterized protein CLUP02_10624 [Colletotrichum lupini]|uniref:Uncharacterized protein n=1 Tax=Colletotrichum lupini TaxID=145971 RepID=A0A9Q8SXP3_9PEZI|nr:uncharacterized protein CLUP02_10624 [Colletotrichum lupini]UQC85128.1 hypothetical protein CLUP02_10624 [Colletotrichum lupini]